jgi:hypothetical protein
MDETINVHIVYIAEKYHFFGTIQWIRLNVLVDAF